MSNLPKKEDVLKLFGKLKVPNQEDFAKLIDFCDVGNTVLSDPMPGLFIEDVTVAGNVVRACDQLRNLLKSGLILIIKIVRSDDTPLWITR